MQHVLYFLRSDDIPALARPIFRVERCHVTLWAMMAALIEGNTASIVVAKTFGGSSWLVTLVWAIPFFANSLSLLWAPLLRGRPRLRTYAALATLAVAVLLSVSLTPSDWQPWGGWIFALQLLLARIFLSGVIVLRSSIWNANYPWSHRGQVAGRLQMLRFMVVLATAAAVGLLFDQQPLYYRLAYPLLGLVGLLSLVPLRRLRVRGERRELEAFHVRLSPQDAHNGNHVGQGLREALAILRSDPRFRGYLVALFLLGSANFMIEPILTVVVTRQMQLGYYVSSLLLDQIPIILMLITIRFWARWFDRLGVLKFRVINSAVWILAFASASVALVLWEAQRQILPAVLGFLILGRVLAGVGRGGGAIGWTLGHLHFARPHQVELYMSIHIAMAGVRGLMMPLLARAAYDRIGPASLLIGLCGGIGAHLVFRYLAARDPGPRPAEQRARQLDRAVSRVEVT